MSRRQLLRDAGAAALATVLAQLPGMLGPDQLLEAASASSSDLTTDTLNALLAFLVPGADDYSTQQGQSTAQPGGVASNAVQSLIYDLDRSVPASVFASAGVTVPASSGVAAMLNSYALQVNPLAIGPFPSRFARLSFAEKAEVFRRIERDLEPSNSELAFVGGILQGFATFLVFSEAGVLDPQRRQLTAQPVGWALTHYAGPSAGWPEFRGYYHGRRRVKGAGPNATRSPK